MITEILISATITTVVAVRAIKKKSLDLSGAITAWLVGFVTLAAAWPFGVCILVFFFVGTKATTYKQEEKRKFEAEFKEGMERTTFSV